MNAKTVKKDKTIVAKPGSAGLERLLVEKRELMREKPTVSLS
jgi:hypothetical protein